MVNKSVVEHTRVDIWRAMKNEAQPLLEVIKNIIYSLTGFKTVKLPTKQDVIIYSKKPETKNRSRKNQSTLNYNKLIVF